MTAGLVMAALNGSIALAYVTIAAGIAPRLELPRSAKVMGAAFLVACALTHVDLAVHSMTHTHGGSFLTEPHMFAIHGIQALVDWGFIILVARQMRVRVRVNETRARAAERDRQFLATLLESMSESVIACDAHGEITLFNRAARELHGEPEPGVPPAAWAERYGLFHPDGATPLATEEIPLVRALRGEEIRDVELVVAAQDGTIRCLLASGRPILDETGRRLGAMVSMHDVTDRERIKQALAQGEADQRRLAREQAALRRVATAVASGIEPDDLFSLVAEEVGQLLAVQGARVVRFDEQRSVATIVGSWRAPSLPQVPPGTVVTLEGNGALSRVAATGRSASVDVRAGSDDGMRRRAAAPIRVGAVLWGALGAASSDADGLPPDAESRLARLAELVAMAIANTAAGEALRVSEHRYRTLTTHAPVGIFELSADGELLLVNERWREIAGLRARDAVGLRLGEALHPDDRERVSGEWREAAANGREFSSEYRYRAPDGRVVWVAGRIVAVHDAAGALSGYLGTISDISARKAAEDQVRRHAGITRTVIEAVPVGISLVDRAGQVVLSNSVMNEWDAARGNPAGDTVYERAFASADLTTDPAAYRAGLRAVVDDPELEAVHRYQFAVSGRSFERFTAPVRDPAGALLGRLFALRDVTAEDLARRATDEFIALASHELRTPLTSVLGYLAVLREGAAGGLTPDQQRYVEIVARNADRLLRLVGDLLVVARGDAGRLGLEMDAVDLGRVVVDCVQGARPVADERRITLVVEAETLAVIADRARVAQVLDNLLSNALKFTPMGGRVSVRAREVAGHAVVEVTDTGVGISPADLAHVFERFYRSATAQSEAIPGTGLGLAIAGMIVEAHGGRIEVQSVEGSGSTFTFRVPIHTAPGAEAPAAVTSAHV